MQEEVRPIMNINSIYCESLSRISSKMFNSDTSTTKKDESGGRRSKRQLKRLDSGPEKTSGRRAGSILIAHAQHKQQIKYQARAGVIVVFHLNFLIPQYHQASIRNEIYPFTCVLLQPEVDK